LGIVPTATPAGIGDGVKLGDVCTRFDFELGHDRVSGSPVAGRYVMQEVGGRLVTAWEARRGDLDSGWITGLEITFPSVYVTVTFFPANGSAPVPMEIVNPAGGTAYGWLSRGMCHAIELQFPE
jgi:hypothetical protein